MQVGGGGGEGGEGGGMEVDSPCLMLHGLTHYFATYKAHVHS
jgi:hypothetical protein